MQKANGIAMFLALATLSVVSVAQAQDGAASYPASSRQAAPIVQGYPAQGYPSQGRRSGSYNAPAQQVFDTQPGPGVSVRSDVGNGVETVTSSSAVTELRITQGRADVTIHHPADHSEILVDLPGGQVSLLKDGLYTFNAGTNTVRVLHGEAEAFTGAKDAGKGTKVKETQQLSFFPNAKLKSVNAYPYELTADLLPGEGGRHGDGEYYRDGYYGGSPAYAGYGYPWGYGYYPYGYGYPFGVGLGFGYYGGFGGFRGGFRR